MSTRKRINVLSKMPWRGTPASTRNASATISFANFTLWNRCQLC